MSPLALDAPQRTQLEKFVIGVRRRLEHDLADQAEGRFGFHADGTVEDDDALSLDASAMLARHELREVIDHLKSLGETSAGAVRRLIREATFTHLNRFVAIRVAEEGGLLPESLARGKQSSGFHRFAELAPFIGDDYWSYLQLCGDELAADAPALFDPRNPLLVLAPSATCLDDLVDTFGDDAISHLWEATDTLGWTYQFFNTGDERLAMREQSPAPRDSRELAVRNQYFTPGYVVDFLVQNTLGRRLMEDDPSTSLIDDLPLLIDPPTEAGSPLNLDDVKILDPACGSGHFLLGCYDLLERAWFLRGINPSDAAPRIVRSLWGVDIDARCAQIASAAIVLRARRHCREAPLPRPNIVTARGLPTEEIPSDFEAEQSVLSLLKIMADILKPADVLGVLLKAEDRIESEVRGMTWSALGGNEASIPLRDDSYEYVERELLDAVQRLADASTSTVADRLFAAEAGDAARLIDVCRERFDIVLMNPPFGEPVSATKAYLREAYPWLPTKDSNLLAAFVGRGLELCKPDGYLGAITSRAGMFLTTFKNWREEILLGNRLVALADLGFGVMEQALVEAAAYVVGPGRPGVDHIATFVRMLKDTNRSMALSDAIARTRVDEDESRLFRVLLTDFASIPGSPVAYWMSQSIRRLFTDLPQLEGNGAEARQGLATGDDFRFVRAFWEVEPRRIARSREETLAGKCWVPFAKGGEYNPYWFDIHLVVDYQNDGERLREFEGSVIRNSSYYFKSGLTWPRRTASGFSPRILPSGCIFGDKGPGIFLDSATADVLAAWLTSRPAQALLASMLAAADETTSGTVSKSYEVGHVQHMPWPAPRFSNDVRARLQQLAAETVELRAAVDTSDETTRRFVAPEIGSSDLAGVVEQDVRRLEDAALRSIDVAREIDEVLTVALDLDDTAIRYLDEEIGPHVGRYSNDSAVDAQLFNDWFREDLDKLVDQVVERTDGRVAATKSFIADRRLELIAQAFEVNPRRLVELRRELAVLPPNEPRQTAEQVFSYLFGCAVGRWDVRIGRDPSLAPPVPDLSGPVPICPPGMLVGSDGLPVEETPHGYPFALAPNRLLVDEPGHPWDGEAAVLRVAEALFDDPSTTVAELLRILGRTSVREYLRRDFFKAHLRRYSKSRRKAPIYWPLTLKRFGWGVWVYAPVHSRETVYAVAHEARRRERLATEAIARLQDEKSKGSDGRAERRVAEELDSETKLAEELRAFRQEAERIAEFGWEPDLDDGIVLNAAPLASLFPAWPEAANERTKIKAGECPWATVSRFKDAL